MEQRKTFFWLIGSRGFYVLTVTAVLVGTLTAAGRRLSASLGGVTTESLEKHPGLVLLLILTMCLALSVPFAMCVGIRRRYSASASWQRSDLPFFGSIMCPGSGFATVAAMLRILRETDGLRHLPLGGSSFYLVGMAFLMGWFGCVFLDSLKDEPELSKKT